MRIGIDVDSVLFPVNELVIIPAWEEAGLGSISIGDITDFDYEKCLGTEYKKVAFEQFKRPDLYDGHYPSLTVSGVLYRLRRKYRVLAVTSPFHQHAGSKWAYCLRAGFNHGDIVMCGDKSLINLDILLDDRSDTIEEIGPNRGLVFDRPWNNGHRMYPFTRAYGWEDVERKVARMAR